MRVRNLALFAGSLMLAASAALAEDVGNYRSASYAAPDREEVTVTAPNIHTERGSAFGLPGKSTLSRRVAFNDLDLRDHRDARALRERVRETARDVCDTLRNAYPQREAGGTSCYRDAVADAMPRVDEAIRDARYSN